MFVLFPSVGAALVGLAGSSSAPSIQSDLADYNPGQTVHLTGSGWDSGGSTVHIVVNDAIGQTWQHTADVMPDSGGNITDSFTLPTYFVAQYSIDATQQVGTTTLSASSSFTDANPSANLDQCDPPTPYNALTYTCATSGASGWVNGNNDGIYFEGDSVPYRLTMDNLSLASHTVTIEWDTTKSGTHALDYITSFDRTMKAADPCDGISGCSGSPSTFAIPADPQVTGAGVTQAAGNFSLYGGTITAVSAYSYPLGTGFSGDKSARITITFTASVANPVLAWAGHIASRHDWGANNAAVAISGSPYHTRLIDLDGSGGNQDRSLSAAAVIFPGSITIVKDATPNGSTSFSFTGSPSPLTNFSLVDDGTSANTKVFSNITNFQTYSVNETPIPSGWTFGNVTCSVTSPNGGSYTTNTTTANIAMNEGENWTCTYTNTKRASLAIVKSTSPANSGTDSFAYSTTNLTPGSFSLDTNPSTATSNEQDFNNLSDFTTTKTVKETLTTGWDLTGISCTGAASGEVTYGTSLTASSNTDTTWQTGDTAVSVAISPGESVQCTYTNKLLPKIVIVKNAKPAQGVFSFDTTGSTSGSGTSWPTGTSAFTLTGSTSGGGNTRTFTVDPGTYTVTEQTQLSWTLTGIGGSTDPLHPYDCVVTGSGGSTGSGVSQGSLTPLDTRTVSITIAYGDTVTCTFENTGNGATRTQGFWATHPQLANIAWFGGTEFGHTFPGVALVSGIGDMTFCSPVKKDMSLTTGTPAEGLRRVMGGFWSSISSKSSSFNPPNQKRTTIDQYRMQLVQQLLAAELNASAFGSLPSSGTFSAWESAYCGSSQTAIKNAQQQAASFNSQGDNSNFTPGTSANSKYARSIANIPYWDVLP